MAGAIRPPWIDKEMFYKVPFNFCDRWCQKCDLAEICKVNKKEQESRKKWIKEGKDPDSWEYVFTAVKESLGEAMMLLEKGAKNWGIDLNKLDYSDYKPDPLPHEFPLYNLIYKYSQKLDLILKNLQAVPVEADERLILEAVKIISHYRFLINAKIYRSLTSKIREEEEKDEELKTYDDKTSAFIAVNGLISIAEALTSLLNHQPLRLLKNRLLCLRKISLDLAKNIDKEFDLNVL